MYNTEYNTFNNTSDNYRTVTAQKKKKKKKVGALVNERTTYDIYVQYEEVPSIA